MSRLTASVLAAMAFGGIHDAGFIPEAPPNTRRGRGQRKGRMTRFEQFLAISPVARNRSPKALKETPRYTRMKKGNVRTTWRDNFARRSSLRAKKYLRRMAEIQL